MYGCWWQNVMSPFSMHNCVHCFIRLETIFGGGQVSSPLPPVDDHSQAYPSLMHAYAQIPPNNMHSEAGSWRLPCHFLCHGNILFVLVTNYMPVGWQACMRLLVGIVVGFLRHVVWMVGYQQLFFWKVCHRAGNYQFALRWVCKLLI